MRLLLLIFIIIVLQTGGISAQDKALLKGLLNLSEKVDTLPVMAHHESGIEVGSSFSTNLKGGYSFDNYVSPHFSFQTSKSWKFDIKTVLGTFDYHNMTLWNYNRMLTGMTGTNNYFGVYGQGSYKVNDKLYFGSIIYIDKSPDRFNLMYGNQNGTNYSGSVFVGYKFSDKVSIQAGVSIQHHENPWDMNNSWINH